LSSRRQPLRSPAARELRRSLLLRDHERARPLDGPPQAAAAIDGVAERFVLLGARLQPMPDDVHRPESLADDQ